ncbi:MAG: hypothetical protein EOL87_15155 [Spartobacteria bacterium]|nr:hypothetical protein [Spartobacteria bacterium]
MRRAGVMKMLRAKMAESLEDSVYTSVHERIEAEKAKMQGFLTTKCADDRENRGNVCREKQ